jgi:hypothetical protein
VGERVFGMMILWTVEVVAGPGAGREAGGGPSRGDEGG